MLVQIGARPDSGFNDPIGMLKDCHRRIETFLAVLVTVAERARGRALQSEERAALESALRYFCDGGRRHTADEEESLFPRLRASGSGALDEVGRLESQHGEAEELHASIERLYGNWMRDGSLDGPEEMRLAAETALLRQLYAEHIAVEESIVFPRAAQLLDTAALAAMGAEFRARRSDAKATG